MGLLVSKSAKSPGEPKRKVRQTLLSEKMKLNCAFVSLPQWSAVSDQDSRSLEETNAKMLVDCIVESEIGSRVSPQQFSGLIENYRCMVYSLTFTPGQLVKTLRTKDESFEGETITVTFLIVYTGSRTAVVACLEDMLKYIDEYISDLRKCKDRSKMREFVPIGQGRHELERMVIYELCGTRCAERSSVEKSEARIDTEASTVIGGFEEATAKIRHFSSESDVYLLRKFVRCMAALSKTPKILHEQTYKGYVADLAQVFEGTSAFDVHKDFQSKYSNNCQLGRERSPGAIILLSSAHLAKAQRLRRKSGPAAIRKEDRPVISIYDMYITDSIHSFLSLHPMRAKRTTRSDFLVLPDKYPIIFSGM